MRLEFVRCGRAPLSICERYDWLMFLLSPSRMASTTSCWVMARPNPRSVPSTSRRYRIFSPSFILLIAIFILQYAIFVKNFIRSVFIALATSPETPRGARAHECDRARARVPHGAFTNLYGTYLESACSTHWGVRPTESTLRSLWEKTNLNWVWT